MCTKICWWYEQTLCLGKVQAKGQRTQTGPGLLLAPTSVVADCPLHIDNIFPCGSRLSKCSCESFWQSWIKVALSNNLFLSFIKLFVHHRIQICEYILGSRNETFAWYKGYKLLFLGSDLSTADTMPDHKVDWKHSKKSRCCYSFQLLILWTECWLSKTKCTWQTQKTLVLVSLVCGANPMLKLSPPTNSRCSVAGCGDAFTPSPRGWLHTSRRQVDPHTAYPWLLNMQLTFSSHNQIWLPISCINHVEEWVFLLWLSLIIPW